MQGHQKVTCAAYSEIWSLALLCSSCSFCRKAADSASLPLPVSTASCSFWAHADCSAVAASCSWRRACKCAGLRERQETFHVIHYHNSRKQPKITFEDHFRKHMCWQVFLLLLILCLHKVEKQLLRAVDAACPHAACLVSVNIQKRGVCLEEECSISQASKWQR